MNLYIWIPFLLLCAFAVPIVLLALNSCPKCHGYCEDDYSCQRRIELEEYRNKVKQAQEKENHEQKENRNPS